MKTKWIILGIAFVSFACGSNNQNAGNGQKGITDSTVKSKATTVNTPKINTDSLVQVIEKERERIESNLKSFKQKILPTKDLRAQIKQKWSKIEYYTENDQIVRIITLPYEKIVPRTEEFYFQKGILILAFINDEGLKYIGKEDKRVGKAYYFSGDAVIKEDNRTNEKETSIRTSDGERLLQEAKEYLELFPKH